MTDPPRPVVRVGAPGAVDRPPPVPPEPPGPPRRRPWLRAGCTLLVAFLLGVAVSELRLQQRDRTERERLDDAVHVVLSGAEASPSVPAGRLAVRVRVENRGARAVELLGVLARGPGLAWQGDQGLPVDETRGVRLTGPFGCAAAGAWPQVPAELRLELRLRAGGEEREVVGWLDTGDAGLQQVLAAACGRVPAGQAVEVRSASSQRSGASLLLRLEIANASVLPQRVLSVSSVDGLAVLLERDGNPVALPLELPGLDPDAPAPPGGPAPGPPLTLRTGLPSCSAAPRLLELELAFDAGPGTPRQTSRFLGDPSRLRCS